LFGEDESLIVQGFPGGRFLFGIVRAIPRKHRGRRLVQEEDKLRKEAIAIVSGVGTHVLPDQHQLLVHDLDLADYGVSMSASLKVQGAI
jgi:hypothetical protein